MENNLYLTLKKKNIDKTDQEAYQRALENWEAQEDHDLLYPDAKLSIDEIYLNDDEDSIHLSASIIDGKHTLGDFSADISLTIDLSLDIIDRYIKKLNKLKTILEAAK